MDNLTNIVIEVLNENGLKITDREFRLKGCIYFGNKNLNYRKEYPTLSVKTDTSHVNELKTETIHNMETFRILIQMAADYIKAQRIINSIDNINTLTKIETEIRDIKFKKILHEND